MKITLHIYLITLLQFFAYLCTAQNDQFKFNLVEGQGGKPLGKIESITQDKHGYMWLAGSSEKCLYRYDGTRIITFRHDDANPNSPGGIFVSSVHADDSVSIWIGFSDSDPVLDQYNPETRVFKHYRRDPNDPESLSGSVKSILKDRQGRLWIGTNIGLDQLDEKTGKFKHYRNEPGNLRSLSSNIVSNIYEDRQGVIWIATGYPWDGKGPDEGGLNRMETDGSFTRYKHDPADPNSLISNKVRAIFEDSRGVFWVGTSGDGLHTMDRKTGRFERHSHDAARPDKLSRPTLKPDQWRKFNDQVSFITEDRTGSIWIGSLFSGINRYDTLSKKITYYNSGNGFPDSTCWFAYQSRDGLLWLATDTRQLYRVDPFHKSIHSTSTTDQPRGFLEDKEGFLWVGTNEGGLLKFDQNGKLIHTFKHDPSDSFSLFNKMNIVISLLQDLEGNIWVGTPDGIGILDKQTQQFSRFQGEFKIQKNDYSMSVPVIKQDKQGAIWIALGGGGLISYNPRNHSIKQFLNVPKDSGSIGIGNVDCILEDSSGNVWAGIWTESGGVHLLNSRTGQFRHYLLGTGVTSLLEDSEGEIWAGTFNGIYRYNKKEDRFSNFLDDNSEISTFFIRGMLEDMTGNLWLYSHSFLIKLNPKTKESFIYGSSFGITENSLEPLAFYRNSKGQFFLGHNKGFYTFFPAELDVNKKLKIILTDILINNHQVLPEKESVLKKPVEDADELKLMYDQNNITFNFAAIDYRAPEAIKYFTMLEGFDNNWRAVNGEKSSFYFNLSPGKYVYRIKAYNNEGTMGEKTVNIHVSPPWWKTWWAYMLYSLFFLVAIFVLYRIQKQRIIQLERQKAQQFELAQAKEIEKAYHELRSTQAQLIQSEKMASLGELTAGIAHEIQNPLNFVNNFSEINVELIDEASKAMDADNKNEAKELLSSLRENEEKIRYHGQRADGIVKSMLQHSRTSSGVKEPADINALADEYLRLAYHGLRAKDKSFNVAMETDFDPAIGMVKIIPQDIGRVLLNIYNNAFYAVTERKNKAEAGYEPKVIISTKRLLNPQSDMRNPQSIEIRVKDNGIGIPQKVIDKIFQPFFTTKPTGQGTGLGLSLSYDIIKAHHGEFKVETKEGEWTEFIIQLPMA